MHIKRLFGQEGTFEDLINHLVDVIADLLEKKPGLPSFIVNILNESPELALFLAASKQDDIPFQLEHLLAEAKQKRRSRNRYHRRGFDYEYLWFVRHALFDGILH